MPRRYNTIYGTTRTNRIIANTVLTSGSTEVLGSVNISGSTVNNEGLQVTDGSKVNEEILRQLKIQNTYLEVAFNDKVTEDETEAT